WRESTFTPVTLKDLHPAFAYLLSLANANVHGLLRRGGHPGGLQTCRIDASSMTPTTGAVLVPVPPGVTHLHVAVVGHGYVVARVTSAEVDGTPVDAEGALMLVQATYQESADKITWSSIVDDDATNAPRAVRVAATASETPRMVRLEVSAAAFSSA